MFARQVMKGVKTLLNALEVGGIIVDTLNVFTKFCDGFFNLDVRVFQKFACVIQVVINRCQFSNTALMLSNAVIYRGF